MSEGRKYISGLETRTKLVLVKLAYEASEDAEGVCGMNDAASNSVKELMRRDLIVPLYRTGPNNRRGFVGFGFTLKGNAAVDEIADELFIFAGRRK